MLVILLPPSEGKVRGGDGPAWDPAAGRFGELSPGRVRVANALKRARGGNERLLGARGDLLAAAREANRTLLGAPTLPAWQRFSGVVWEHLDPGSLGGRARRRAEAGLVIVSAATGLSAWDDHVPDFRLKLSASLKPMGNLASFWRGAVSPVLDDFAAGATVVDLLPNEHRAAWVPDESRYELVRPEFTTADGTPAGHAGKAAKGRVARMLLDAGGVVRGTVVELDGVRVTFG